MPEAIRVFCASLTRTGRPCKRYALPHSDYCRSHQPQDEPVEPDTARSEIPDQEARQRLAAELDQVMAQLKQLAPDYTPPPFSPQALVQLIQENLDKLKPEVYLGLVARLRRAIGEDYFDLDTWKGIWYMLNYSLQYQTDFVKRRVTGEYETDEWGLDQEVFDRVRPLFEFMYKVYWRVQTTGLDAEHVPAQGRALLVANRSGQLPWDGSMVATAVYLEHPAQRLVRALYAECFPALPFFSDLFTKCGQALATADNARRLLEQDQVVAVFPQGHSGAGRLATERYRLAHFEHGEFIQMALKTRSPIIPVSVVGAQETYISLYDSSTLAGLTGLPHLPASPALSWLGLLGLVPLPTKWYIDFGLPISTDGYGPEAADNPALVLQLNAQVRNVIQEMLYSRLSTRRSVF